METGAGLGYVISPGESPSHYTQWNTTHPDSNSSLPTVTCKHLTTNYHHHHHHSDHPGPSTILVVINILHFTVSAAQTTQKESFVHLMLVRFPVEIFISKKITLIFLHFPRN